MKRMTTGVSNAVKSGAAQTSIALATGELTSASLITHALELLHAGKDGHLTGVLEHKKHWKFFANLYGLREPERFNAKQIASQYELGIGRDAQTLDFVPLIVLYDEFFGKA